jgi:hypothetical protein
MLVEMAPLQPSSSRYPLEGIRHSSKLGMTASRASTSVLPEAYCECSVVANGQLADFVLFFRPKQLPKRFADESR